MKKLLTNLCILCVCLLLACAPAFAAYETTGTIPVTVRQTGPITQQTYRFVLEPKDGAPLPVAGEKVALTEDGTAALEITADSARAEAAFAVRYARPGVYNYTLRQEPGADSRMTYDSAVYQVTVYVVNDGNGGLEATTVAFRNAATEKSDIEFVNDREPDPTATPSPTPTPEPTATVKPGESPKTGVQDRWPAYLIGAAVVLALGACSFVLLRRKEDHADENK